MKIARHNGYRPSMKVTILPADFGLSFEALVDPREPSPLNYNLDPLPIPLLSA
jgi:hypothetical protein